MKHPLLSLLSLLLLSCSASALSAEEAPVSLAVIGFRATEPGLKEEAQKLATLLEVQLSLEPKLQLVERAELEEVMAELELGLGGALQQESTAKLGHMIGAQGLVTGQLMALDGKRVAVAKLMAVETSRVLSVAVDYAEGGLAAAAKQMAADLAKQAQDPKLALNAVKETWPEMIARLKKLLPAGKPLPSVMVSIKEEHLTQRVPDPAVQTEVLKVLQDLGFKTSADGLADYMITGEAFSERGAQRGALISCKARLEVMVSTGKKEKLWVERQTCAALDTAELVAGKTALQLSGRMVAERLVRDYLVKQL